MAAKKYKAILAIESSCDDTSAAIIVDGAIKSNVVASQLVHEKYGGVVPELASRKHQENIAVVVDRALKDAGLKTAELSAIACTSGPGLMGPLLVGLNFAKAMSLALNLPFIEIHHMKAHILAHFIDDPIPQGPFLCLTVSGGHTQIVRVNSPSDMTVLGTTLDDAAGEAFDKSGKLLGLPYPAGPQIDRLAREGKPIYSFSEPQVLNLDFSFSGLKTGFMNFLKKEMQTNPQFITSNLENICASLQQCIVDILVKKLIQASEQEELDQIAIAGGVSANSGLRKALEIQAQKRDWNIFIPHISYCTDNAAMIAMAAHFKYLEGDFSPLDTEAKPRWPM